MTQFSEDWRQVETMQMAHWNNMADLLNVYMYCARCAWTGSIQDFDEHGNPISITCPRCGGDGELLWGIMREEEPPG